MKKKVLSIALIAMSLISLTSMAQNNSTSSNNENSPRIEKIKGMKGDKDGKKEMRNKERKANLFEGITLTDAQKTKLDQLDAKRKEMREQKKMARKEEKAQKDSMKMVNRKADKKAYLEEVKAIIGPDQYVVFLENFYVNNGNNKDGNKAFRQGNKFVKNGMAQFKDKKNGHKKSAKGDRGDRKMKIEKNKKAS